VAELRHSFHLIASFDQRLSLVVLACVCLTSFLAWPPIDNGYYQLAKWLFFMLILGFFLYQFWQLSRWECGFSLDVSGVGTLTVCADLGKKFALRARQIVTPFVCLMFIELDSDSEAWWHNRDKRLIIIWSDMLDDTDYRHLCRLLLTCKLS